MPNCDFIPWLGAFWLRRLVLARVQRPCPMTRRTFRTDTSLNACIHLAVRAHIFLSLGASDCVSLVLRHAHMNPSRLVLICHIIVTPVMDGAVQSSPQRKRRYAESGPNSTAMFWHECMTKRGLASAQEPIHPLRNLNSVTEGLCIILGQEAGTALLMPRVQEPVIAAESDNEIV